MASYVTPEKAAAFTTYVFLVSQANTKIFQVNPTLAAGDAMVKIDDGVFNPLATLPVVSPAGSDTVKVELSAAEMNGDNIVVRFKDQAGAEWCDAGFNLQTTTKQIDDLATDAELTLAHGAGSWQRVTGADPNVVHYILEANGNPVAGGQVWVYTDALCTNLVAYGITDTFGEIDFYLIAGTYYVKRFKDNVVIFTPTVITMVVT